MSGHSFMSGRHTSQIIWHRTQTVVGPGDCSIDAAAFVGQVTYADGERGLYVGIETVGAVDDPTTFRGKAIVLLDDGSVLNETFEGKTESTHGPDSFAGTGTVRMEGGTGRAADLRGSSQFRWSVVGDKYEDEFSA